VGTTEVKSSISKNLECLGKMTLYVDDKAVASAPFRTQTGHYGLCGEGLCIGHDSGDAVSSEYKPKFPFTGGRVIKVVFDIANDVYVDVERKLAAAMARD
jgi:arylsulfatase